ncbi:Uncharacterised protein [uncultured archaeon]|nr:Uncharacterised protein [uncultured archaeon]
MGISFSNLADEWFKEKSESPIYHSAKENSEYLIKKIFEKAKRNVAIYAGGENISLYDNEEVKNKIKSKKLEVLVIAGNEQDTKELSKIFTDVHIKCLNRDLTLNLEYFVPDKEYHQAKYFLAVDNQYVRIEKPQSSSSDIKAISSICFVKNKNLATLLTNLIRHLIRND